jgi:hypothetical protein
MSYVVASLPGDMSIRVDDVDDRLSISDWAKYIVRRRFWELISFNKQGVFMAK